MERLIYRKFKGLEVRCLKCNKSIHKDNSPKNGCKHPIERTAYRGIVWTPNTKSKRTGITLNARTYDAAVKELIDYRTDVLNGSIKSKNEKFNNKPYLVEDCMLMYIDYLSDIDVPDYKKKHNSEGYINTRRSFMSKFLNFLESEKINRDTFRISDINERIIESYYLFLNNSTKSNDTFNHNVKALRAVFKYLIEEKGYNIKNPFKEIVLRPTKGKDESISSPDFYDLLNVISPRNSIQQIGKTKRNMYKPWLKDAIKLKAYTGVRNFQIYNMTWDMIQFEGSKPIYIKSPNEKTNKLRNLNNEQEKDYVYIPVIEELEHLLLKLNMNRNKGTKNFILAPDIINRKDMEEKTSRCFTFFFKKLKRNYKCQFAYLRSTYITAQEIYAYKQGDKIRQHADLRVTKKHYINDKQIARYISLDRGENKFRVFEK